MRNTYSEDRKRQLWEMVVLAAIASGRNGVEDAVAKADAIVVEAEKRWPVPPEEEN